MMNKGKLLENDFKESCKERDIWVYRIKDTYSVIKSIDPGAFIPKAPADYIVHNNGKLWFVECKETDKKFITIEHDGINGMIKEHQIFDLSNIHGRDEQGCFILQFLKGTDEQQTYYITVENLVRCLQSTGKTSVNRMDIAQFGGVLLDQIKLRTHYRYSVDKVFKK